MKKDILYENLYILLKQRFLSRSINIDYQETEDSSSMSYRDIDYEFKFDKGRFFMRVVLREKGLERLLGIIQQDSKLSNKNVDNSRYFSNPRVFEDKDSIVVSCRIKRRIKPGKEESLFRDQLWAIIMKPVMEKVYNYS